ncbi:UNVERIFIED_CONTAM: hypothetical protein PYX00_007442 [Menopon gallinae]|uniref:DNA/RNA non-specific endonuclease/pyrophosphatase/phosphodiesterase domain-containing protein n=1 Tax=Menopon gallinae TaxID=328185 RepID=A0AAW2HJ40_9NEOP
MLTFLVFALLSIAPANFQQLECRLSVPPTDNREKIYKEVFRWTFPKDSINSDGKPVRSGTTVGFTCDNGFLKNEFISDSYTFKCDNGKFNRTFHYEDLLCRNEAYKGVAVAETAPSMFRSKLFKCSEPEYKLYQVKLTQPDGKVKVLFSSCVDKKQMKSKFGHQPRRNEKPLLRHRPDDAVWGFDGFGEDTNERFYLSKGYVKKTQAKRIARAYPDRKKRATCEYINAAPQWDAFNSGSWSLVEREAREMLQKDTNDWEIYTGTYGIIPTPRGPLYVAPVFDHNGRFKKQLLPVPMLYWKIVHNLKDKAKSRAFVGVNNPEYKSPEEIPQSYKICTPIRPNGNGTYYHGNEFQGFTYECKLEDLLEKLKTTEKIVK